jgi:hypothetical protein
MNRTLGLALNFEMIEELPKDLETLTAARSTN